MIETFKQKNEWGGWDYIRRGEGRTRMVRWTRENESYEVIVFTGYVVDYQMGFDLNVPPAVWVAALNATLTEELDWFDSHRDI